VDSIRQIDVDLNFLLVLCSTVGLYCLVCLLFGENRTNFPLIERSPGFCFNQRKVFQVVHAGH